MKEDKGSIFEHLSKIDCSQHIEKKNGFSYLSWTWAWSLLLKNYPTARRIIYEDATGFPCFSSPAGAMVKVGILIHSIERIEWLAITDYRNRTIPIDKVGASDINTAIERCSVKAIARHGLGLYIYAGEDVPEEVEDAPKPKPRSKAKPKPKPKPSGKPELLIGSDKYQKVIQWVAHGNDAKRLREEYHVPDDTLEAIQHEVEKFKRKWQNE